MSQSPLHRGGLFNVAGSGNVQPEVSVSIPSSSGRSLQLIELSTLADLHYDCLNPLFIGEVSSTYIGLARNVASDLSQSPLHRGGLFNLRGRNEWKTDLTVSIPSSSGRSLQPWFSIALNNTIMASQSPLHRGGLFNLRSRRCSKHRGSRSQSPLHRGGLFNLIFLPPSAPDSHMSQSPLHRGGLFNTIGVWRCEKRENVSIPSSSGRSLQHSNRRDVREGLVGLNPLFIGEVSSTARDLMITKAVYNGDALYFYANLQMGQIPGRFA